MPTHDNRQNSLVFIHIQKKIADNLASLETETSLRKQLALAQQLRIWLTLLNLQAAKEKGRIWREAEQAIKEVLNHPWAKRFGLELIRNNNKYSKAYVKFLQAIINKDEYSSEQLDELVNRLIPKQTEAQSEPQMSGITPSISVSSTGYQGSQLDQLAEHELLDIDASYAKDYTRIKAQMDGFSSAIVHPIQLAMRLVLPRFLNWGNRHLYNSLYYLDLFYGREVVNTLLTKVEGETPKQKLNSLNKLLVDATLEIQVRPKLSKAEQHRLRKLKIAINRFAERYNLDLQLRAVTTSEFMSNSQATTPDDQQEPGRVDNPAQRTAATQPADKADLNLIRYEAVPNLGSRKNKQVYRFFKARMRNASVVISGIVALGQAALAAFGMMSLLTPLAVAFPPALPLVVAFTAITFVAALTTNYLLLKNDVSNTLIDFFVRFNVFSNLNWRQGVFTLAGVGLCAASGILISIMTGVAIHSMLLVILPAIAVVFPPAWAVAIPMIAVSAAIFIGAISTVAFFGILFKAWVSLSQGNLFATVKQNVLNNLPTKETLTTGSYSSRVGAALKSAFILGGQGIAMGIALTIATVATIAAVSLMQLNTLQILTLFNGINAPVASWIFASLTFVTEMVFNCVKAVSLAENVRRSVTATAVAAPEKIKSFFQNAVGLIRVKLSKNAQPDDLEKIMRVPPRAPTRLIDRIRNLACKLDFISFYHRTSTVTTKAVLLAEVGVNAIGNGGTERGVGDLASLGGLFTGTSATATYVTAVTANSAALNAESSVVVPSFSHKKATKAETQALKVSAMQSSLFSKPPVNETHHEQTSRIALSH